jgi:pimeloyl-ACP methyl ester carboxylesterase
MLDGKIAGVSVHHHRFGDGPDPALFLHCSLGHGGMWRGVARHLPKTLQITAPDFPDHGRSSPFPEGRNVHDVSTEVAEAFLSDGMHLVGHSFGGTVALRLALRHPEKVKSLTLIEPVLFCAARPTPELQALRDSEAQAAEQYHNGHQEDITRRFNRRWGGGRRWHEFSDDVRAMMIRQMAFVLAVGPSIWDDTHDLLNPDRMAQLNCPVSLIRGGDSEDLQQAIHLGLSKGLPQAKDHVIQGAGHMLVVTHPAEAAEIIENTMGGGKA